MFFASLMQQRSAREAEVTELEQLDNGDEVTQLHSDHRATSSQSFHIHGIYSTPFFLFVFFWY